MNKLDKTITKNFKRVLGRFVLWASTAYVIANACKNCREVIKRIKDINDADTFI